ncbi:hypothetical protein J5S76_08350 [Bacillus amyloliquefaciens]|nr:hypothetical protein [Bacillus amyloliquefaciens]
MATLDDDLAKAVTEGFRQAQIDIVNQDLILSGTGDVTVTLADGSKKTGPSWTKLIAQAGAAGASAAAAKTSETNALASKNAAAQSATNAATSEGNALASKNAAKTSETNAKTSETNAKTSENNAKTSETNAAASLAAAQQLTSVPYEDAPYPDVWAPLSDDLRLLAGFAPYDTLTISGKVLELPSKSMTFVRSTSATYIDKSGMLQTASINEPRFERGGLLVEGQGTNYFINSDDPTKWNSDAGITKESIVDGTTQAKTYKGTATTTSSSFLLIDSPAVSVSSGDIMTLSARFKGSTDRIRFGFTLNGTLAATIFIDCSTGAVVGTPTAGLTYTISQGSDGYIYASATFAVSASGAITGNIRFISATNIASGAVIYVQTVQFEKAPVATSYIPTSSAAVTRAADNLRLQPLGNIGYRMTGDLFNRTLSIELSVDKFSPPSTNYHDLIRVVGANNDIILRVKDTSLRSYRGGDGPVINTAPPFLNKTYVQTIDASNKLSLYFDGKTDNGTLGPTNPASIPTLLEIVGHTNAVYHIRNFRIWHRLLTLNQINGLR